MERFSRHLLFTRPWLWMAGMLLALATLVFLGGGSSELLDEISNLL